MEVGKKQSRANFCTLRPSLFVISERTLVEKLLVTQGRSYSKVVMSTELGHQIGSFLAAHHVMSLATSGSTGPHATSLFYACDGLALVWVSELDAQHSRNIETDPRVAATVAPDYSDFAAIRGVQIAGTARRIVAANERMLHLAQLRARYPFLVQLTAGPLQLQQAYARASVYRLQPARIILIDNTKGFGHRETLEISL